MVHVARMPALALILITFVSAAHGESSALKKLGLPPETRALLIHADDVGMNWAAHEATVRSIKEGSVTCGSAMVPCSWFPATAKACKEDPTLDIGLHLTLTSEWGLYRWGPVAGRSVVPLLVDEEGYMWRDVLPVYKSVGGKIDQVATEIQAQIDLSRKLGLEPTHLDSHMGTLYYNEGYFKTVCNLALENDVPFMTFAYNEELMNAQETPLRYMTKELTDKLEDAGFPMLDALIKDEQVGDTYEQGLKNYTEIISSLKPGVTLIILHLGVDGPELKNTTSRHWARDQQFRIFTDPKMAEHLKKENIHLLGWRELKEKIWDKRDKSVKKLF
ncbi:MAG: Carbohydrate deacetylase [bacterium]|nr:Carbohydrate deacetylase [bacterium]